MLVNINEVFTLILYLIVVENCLSLTWKSNSMRQSPDMIDSLKARKKRNLLRKRKRRNNYEF